MRSLLCLAAVAAPFNGHAVLHGEGRYLVHEGTIALAAMVFPPSHFRRIALKVLAADVVVNTDLGPAQAGEEGFRLVCASALQTVRLLVVDALHLVVGVQDVIGRRFVGMDRGALGNPATDHRHQGGFI